MMGFVRKLVPHYRSGSRYKLVENEDVDKKARGCCCVLPRGCGCGIGGMCSRDRWLKCGPVGPGSVNHVTVVIFLEFFAWGLVTTILPGAVRSFFGPQQMWLVLGLTQGIKGLLSFCSAPLLGALSDLYGRRWFLLLTVACTCLPLPFLFISDLWWHVIVVAFSGAFAVTFSIVFAYVSDITTTAERSGAFGQVSATFAASLVISPALGSLLQELYGTALVYGLSCGVAMLDVLYIIAFVPESMTAGSYKPQNNGKSFLGNANPFSSIRSAFSSTFMLQFSAIVFFSYLAEAGEYQCLMLYLENTLHFSKLELAAYIAVLGLLSIISQTYVLEVMSSRMQQKNIILLGLVFSTIQLALYGIVTEKWAIFIVTIVAALGSITYPALSSFISVTSSPEQQGVAQGMVTGIRSLCNGLGPAIFGLLFQLAEVPLDGDEQPEEFESPERPALFPGAPFLIGSGSVLLSLFIAFTLPDRHFNMADAMHKAAAAAAADGASQDSQSASLVPPPSPDYKAEREGDAIPLHVLSPGYDSS
eukprot:m.142970 g.142970  ORF g.142970 m.142970 type:complete len:532 (-) comp16727_c0_seq1:420-2015(-)